MLAPQRCRINPCHAAKYNERRKHAGIRHSQLKARATVGPQTLPHSTPQARWELDERGHHLIPTPTISPRPTVSPTVRPTTSPCDHPGPRIDVIPCAHALGGPHGVRWLSGHRCELCHSHSGRCRSTGLSIHRQGGWLPVTVYDLAARFGGAVGSGGPPTSWAWQCGGRGVRVRSK